MGMVAVVADEVQWLPRLRGGCVPSALTCTPRARSCSLSPPPPLPPPPTEYVHERILALRQQHPGQYRNASVVRTNAMKFLTNYFHKGQLTKLFFLFAVRRQGGGERSVCAFIHGEPMQQSIRPSPAV